METTYSDINTYDIIIVGSGLSGLYCAYNIKKINPTKTFLILEKSDICNIGGRAKTNMFYNHNIVTGAGIGRKNKDKLLYSLLTELNFDSSEISEYGVRPIYSKTIEQKNLVNTKKIIKKLKIELEKLGNHSDLTFEEFAIDMLGKNLYKKFVISSSYTDYEKEDVYEVLYHHGMEDNICCWQAFNVPWHKLITKLYDSIGSDNFKFSSEVTQIIKSNDKFTVVTGNGTEYITSKIIIGSTIDVVRNLLPNYSIYNQIGTQPFLRIYAKFDTDSIQILKDTIKGFTCVNSPLQKIIPIDQTNGVYMIVYNDNKNSIKLKPYTENTRENRYLYEKLVEHSLSIQSNKIKILAIRSFYWNIGTHYYKPLNTSEHKSRKEFIYKAQHPEHNIFIIGECVSRNQGWVEGALQSVQTILNEIITSN